METRASTLYWKLCKPLLTNVSTRILTATINNSPILTSQALRSTFVELAATKGLGRNRAEINGILDHAFSCGSLEFWLLEVSLQNGTTTPLYQCD